MMEKFEPKKTCTANS